MAKISVVIPCFNQGQFLDEAVGSVLRQDCQDLEIIIVNDGSTDPLSQKILADYQRDRTRVIHTTNQGLAAARNNGIHEARGQYILPLDADDRIEPGYLRKAAEVLDSQPEVGIVYCRARLFGSVEAEWKLPEYSLKEMLKDNVIFCSGMFRRADWQLVGGYDPEMVYGWEDYDFWLSLIERGRRVYRIPEILFCYRVASGSMVRSKERWQKVAMFRRIFQKHSQLFTKHIDVWLEEIIESRERFYTSRLYVDCGDGISDATSVSRKVEATTNRIDFDLSWYEHIKALRFDPIDVPCVVYISSVQACYEDGRVTTVQVDGDNATLVKSDIRYFSTDDPQCFPGLTPENLAGISSLSVELQFQSLEIEALKRIVELQTERIEKLQESIRSFPILRKAWSRLAG